MHIRCFPHPVRQGLDSPCKATRIRQDEHVRWSIMTRTMITAWSNDTVKNPAALFARHEISAVPVCDKDSTPLGIISEGDLMRPFRQAIKSRRDWWAGSARGGHQCGARIVGLHAAGDNRRPRDLMTAPAITTREGAPVAEIADLPQRHRIKRVPITKDGKVVGIVSRPDLVRPLAREPDALTSSV